VIAARGEIEILIPRVSEQIPLDVHAERIGGSAWGSIDVVRSSLEHNFTEELELVGDVGGHEEVELTERKGGLVSRQPCRVIVVAMEAKVAESADAQQRLAHVHALGLGVLSWLRLVLLRGRLRWAVSRSLCWQRLPRLDICRLRQGRMLARPQLVY